MLILCYAGRMKTLIQLGMLIAVVMGAAFAQESEHCYKTDEYTDVCEFGGGTVHVQTNVGDQSWSEWYTAAQWAAKEAKEARVARAQTKAEAQKYAAWAAQNNNGEKAAQSWHGQEGCENDGFIWVDAGLNKGCHYPAPHKRNPAEGAK